MDAPKATKPHILGYGFTRFPRIIIDEHLDFTKKVPGSFWKFTLVLWRDIVDGNPEFKATKPLTQFHMRRATASKWAHAYSVSGLFNVVFGEYSPTQPRPTQFYYVEKSNPFDWEYFLTALNEQIAEDKKNHIKPDECPQLFAVELGFRLYRLRSANKASNAYFHELLAEWVREGRIKKGDSEGRYVWDRRPSTDRSRVVYGNEGKYEIDESERPPY